MPTSEITFKAVIRNGKLEPVDSIQLEENATVEVSIRKPIKLISSRGDDPHLKAIRESFGDLPPFDIDREVDLDREERV